MAIGLSQSLGRLNSLIEKGKFDQPNQKVGVLNRLERIEDRLTKQEANLTQRQDQIAAKLTQFIDQNPGNAKRTANLSALQERLAQRHSKLQEQRAQLEQLRSRLNGPGQPGQPAVPNPPPSGNDAVNVDLTPPPTTPGVGTEPVGPQPPDSPLAGRNLLSRKAAAQVGMRFANERALKIRQGAQDTSEVRELVDAQVKSAVELRSALRSGDSEKIQSAQEKLFSLVEEQHGIEQAAIVAKGGKASDLQISESVFTSVDGATDFIAAKREEFRDLGVQLKEYGRAEQSITKNLQAARSELLKVAKEEQVIRTVQQAELAALQLSNDILNSSDTALGAHSGLNTQSAQLLTE